MKKILNFINGEFVEPTSKEYLENVSPINGDVYSLIPDSDERDVQKALNAANQASLGWAQTQASQRSQILQKMASIIDSKKDELAKAETIDNGKPIRLSKQVDIPRSSSNLKFFAEMISQFKGDHYPSEEHVFNYTVRKPLGVVACISPWNLPLYLLTWKIAPALITGNTVVAKPSEITPMTAFLLGEIANEAGLPKGVLNIIHGTGEKVGSPLVSAPLVKGISFTGSTLTGRSIAEKASPTFKKVSLEMGGKNPNIIFEDCDFDKAVNTTVRSSFENQGQICLCGSRIFVQRSIYEKFKEALKEKTSKMIIGDPLSEKTDLGALVSKGHFDKVSSYIDLAKEEKGTILFGGEKPQLDNSLKDGYYLRPTLIEGLDPFSRTNQEEIFGPVASITPFDSEEEVLEWANSTTYGLAGTIWTQDLKRAHRLANKVNSGILWVNCWMKRDLRTPFGGLKQSGVGKEGGLYALNFFTEEKNICVDFS